jgi:hypothetical protein
LTHDRASVLRCEHDQRLARALRGEGADLHEGVAPSHRDRAERPLVLDRADDLELVGCETLARRVDARERRLDQHEPARGLQPRRDSVDDAVQDLAPVGAGVPAPIAGPSAGARQVGGVGEDQVKPLVGVSDGKEIPPAGVDAQPVQARVHADAEHRGAAAVAGHDPASAARGCRQGDRAAPGAQLEHVRLLDGADLARQQLRVGSRRVDARRGQKPKRPEPRASERYQGDAGSSSRERR